MSEEYYRQTRVNLRDHIESIERRVSEMLRLFGATLSVEEDVDTPWLRCTVRRYGLSTTFPMPATATRSELRVWMNNLRFRIREAVNLEEAWALNWNLPHNQINAGGVAMLGDGDYVPTIGTDTGADT